MRLIPALALLLSACAGHNKKFDRMETDVRRALPLGTPVLDAGHILDSLGIKHSAFETGTGTIRALSGPIEKNLVMRADAQFVLFFDSTQRLTGIDARKIYTGP